MESQTPVSYYASGRALCTIQVLLLLNFGARLGEIKCRYTLLPTRLAQQHSAFVSGHVCSMTVMTVSAVGALIDELDTACATVE